MKSTPAVFSFAFSSRRIVRPVARFVVAGFTLSSVGAALADTPPTGQARLATATAPVEIKSLDDALAVASVRNPTILQAEERIIRTSKTIAQILNAARRPQISTSATYTRLSGLGAAFGGGGAGISPAQLQNPFGVGLNFTPPGTQTVQLSGGNLQTSAGSGFSTSAVNVAPVGGGAGAGAGGVVGRSVQTPDQAPGQTRQTTGGDGTGGNTGGDTTGGVTGGNTSGGITGGGNGATLDQRSVRIAISQLIDITGIVHAAQQLGKFEEGIAALDLTRARQDIGLQVRNAYYSILRNQALVAVSQAAVTQSEEQVRVTEAQLKQGVVAPFDVLRARTQLANNQQQLIAARNQVSITKNSFANLLGLDPATPVILTAPVSVPDLPNLDEAELLREALQTRPEAKQAELNIQKSLKNTRLARRNTEPFLTASLSGNYNPNPALVANETATGSFTLQLSVPLYDGGATRAAQDVARVDERLALLQQDQFARGIKAEVQQAVIAVKDAQERRLAADASLEQAREAFRLSGVRYQNGVDTQLSVNDAQTALTQAETNAVNARFDYLNALARLSYSLGR